MVTPSKNRDEYKPVFFNKLPWIRRVNVHASNQLSTNHISTWFARRQNRDHGEDRGHWPLAIDALVTDALANGALAIGALARSLPEVLQPRLHTLRELVHPRRVELQL